MFTSQQLRTRAAEFRELISGAGHPDAARELQRQARTFTDLADHEDRQAKNLDTTVPRTGKDGGDHELMPALTTKRSGDNPTAAEDDEQILRCLGAAVIMQWNNLPTKLQKELFDNASSMDYLLQAGAVKGQIARFLHNHKDDDPAPKA